MEGFSFVSTYICDSHRPAQAKSLKDAAKIFALRKARIEFGRSAKVRGLKQWADGDRIYFEAWIGLLKGDPIIGSPIRVMFSVYRVGYEESK